MIFYNKNEVVNILLFKENKVSGIIKIYKRTKEQGILDIFIRPRYRCTWINKNYYFYLKNDFIEIVKKYGYNLVITKLNNIKSLRLLNHFGFNKYNDKFYFLVV